MGELVEALAARLPAGAVALEHAWGIERAGAGLACGHRGRPGIVQTESIVATEARGWPAAALRRSCCGGAPRRHAVRLVGDGDCGLPTAGHPASPRRVRLCRSARRGTRPPRMHVLEREVPGRAPEGTALLRRSSGGRRRRVLGGSDEICWPPPVPNCARPRRRRAAPVLDARRTAGPSAMPQYRVGHSIGSRQSMPGGRQLSRSRAGGGRLPRCRHLRCVRLGRGGGGSRARRRGLRNATS